MAIVFAEGPSSVPAIVRLTNAIKYWLPVLIWLGVIFVGSSDLMSAEHTSRIIAPFLHWLKPDISPEAVAQVQFFVRKGAHLTEYAILALLLFRALGRGTGVKTKMSGLCLLVWMGSTLVGAADEYHQSFVPSRGSSARDVMIDSSGAILGLLFGRVWSRRSSRKSSTQWASRP